MTYPITMAFAALPLVFGLGIMAPSKVFGQEATTTVRAQAEAAIELEAVVDFAGERVGKVVAKFQAAGYKVIDMSRTLLGRIRLTLENGSQVRQIVVSRSTGEIMFDAVTETRAVAGAAAAVETGGSVEIGVTGATTSVESDTSVDIGVAGTSATVETDGSVDLDLDVKGGGLSTGGSGSVDVNVGVGLGN